MLTVAKSITGLTCVYMAAAVLIVPRDNYVCPSDTVMFTCVLDQQSSKLKWRVTFMHQSITPIERTFLASIDQPGRTRMSENNVGQSVTFTLNSVIPNINSTMTATIQNSPVYTQMSVKCNNGSETFGDSEISTVYIVMQAPLLDPNVTLTINEYKITWIELQIKWRRHTFPTLYFVHVYSTSINNHESRMTSTYNNSVTWLLPYNSEYNISLVARNCMGSSVPVSIPLTVGSYHDYHSGPMQPSCGIPMVQTNVVVNGTNHINFTVGYLLTYFCNRSSSNTVAKAATSVCAEGGKWIPNPLEYTCENLPNSRGFTISSIVTAAIMAVVVALVLCAAGVFVSCIVVLRCTRKHPKKDIDDDKQSAKSNDVVYDEVIHVGLNPNQIIMEDNTAYGEFSQSMV